jgi:signal transduction histidine kinase
VRVPERFVPALRVHDERLVAGVCGIVAGLLTAGVIWLSGGPQDHAALVTAARALIVAAPVAVGVYAWREQREAFGLLMIAAGLGWLVTALAESPHAVPYSIGRIAGWVVEVQMVHLFLAFPTGWLETRADRILVGATVATAAVTFAPRALLAYDFTVPAPVTSCVRDCPPNAFAAVTETSGLVTDVLRPLGAVLIALIMAGVVVQLHRRLRRAQALEHHVVRPVLAVAILRAVLVAAAILGRDLFVDRAWMLDAVVWSLAFALPLLAAAVAIGLVGSRIAAGDATRRLASQLASDTASHGLRAALADALADPVLVLAYPAPGDPGGWVDAEHVRIVPPQPGSGRCLVPIHDRGMPIAAIVTDAAVEHRPEFLEPVASIVVVALRDQRLTADVRWALREIQQSRARIATTAVRERERIERDLHDSAQQRLVALRIGLDRTRERLGQDPDRTAEGLDRLTQDVDEALREIRSLARGIYPPVLTEAGLMGALQVAVARCPFPVAITGHRVVRHAAETESAVYFCVLEALQNVTKHAPQATEVVVRLDEDPDGLRFTVADDDPSAPEVLRPGTGVTNMRDRVAALGGGLDVRTTPGRGTVVSGWVPVGNEPAAALREDAGIIPSG